ncbi:MAG TPA: DUF4382 domain-containing protein [Saprospiraceae bacterium]|nr:DUF4382 domain-containing protein [Saprospiraceae bacterium]
MKFSERLLRCALYLCIPLLFWQCEKDNAAGNGQLRIELTDAPVDDANVQGVFITVTEVHVDGKLWTGADTKQTIDLMTLQEGNVQSLGIGEVEAKSYDRISLVLDLEEDANGSSPGCYVQTMDNQKHNLATSASSEQTIEITGSEFDVMDGSSTTVVIDFDLRKSLRYGNPNEPSSDYAFGTNAEMNAALRFVSKNRAGHIEGHCTDLITASDKIVVYAYAKGEYNRQQEVSPPADEQFGNAVTSASVDAQGDYRLSWLEEGDYELVFASYQDDGNNGTMDLQGTLNLTTLLGIDLKSISVGVSATVSIDVTVTGILPL